MSKLSLTNSLTSFKEELTQIDKSNLHYNFIIDNIKYLNNFLAEFSNLSLLFVESFIEEVEDPEKIVTYVYDKDYERADIEYASDYGKEIGVMSSVRYLKFQNSSIWKSYTQPKFEQEIYLLAEDLFNRFKICPNYIFFQSAKDFEFHSNNSIIYKLDKETPKLSSKLKTIDSKISKLKLQKCYMLGIGTNYSQNPIFWPLLNHELFHIIYRNSNYFKTNIEKINPIFLEEVIVEYLSTSYFGPSYISSRLTELRHNIDNMKRGIPDVENLNDEEPQHPSILNIINIFRNYHFYEDFDPSHTNIINSRIDELEKYVLNRIKIENKKIFEKEKEVTHKITTQLSNNNRLLKQKYSHLENEESVLYTRVCYKNNIPVSVEPKILFNALFDQYESIRLDFISLSLKKYHVKKTWDSIKNKKFNDTSIIS